MPAIDFKDIPPANKADGQQDTFELFARDFLTFLGYKIISGPDRGADGGKDLIVLEKRTGVGGESTVKWLVSCKHKAHSGRSVTPTDDPNITDRVKANKCDGFIGFYSTLPSNGLSTILEGLKPEIESLVYDREFIESQMLHSSLGLKLAKRFFLESMKKWLKQDRSPAKIFKEEPKLRCKVCDKDLLGEDSVGIITLWQKLKTDYETEKDHFEHVFWTCKGSCDTKLSNYIRSNSKNLIDGWEDINDVKIPTIFIKWIFTLLNELRDGTQYSDEAFKEIKEFLLNVFPYICRDLTEEDGERITSLSTIPSFLGGLGYES